MVTKHLSSIIHHQPAWTNFDAQVMVGHSPASWWGPIPGPSPGPSSRATSQDRARNLGLITSSRAASRIVTPIASADLLEVRGAQRRIHRWVLMDEW